MHKKRKMFFMLMVLSLLLCGCGDHELENRSFPLAVGLESEKQGCRVVFNVHLFKKSERSIFLLYRKITKKTALRVSTFLITKH